METSYVWALTTRCWTVELDAWEQADVFEKVFFFDYPFSSSLVIETTERQTKKVVVIIFKLGSKD